MSNDEIGFIQPDKNNIPDIETRMRDIIYLSDFGISVNGSQNNYDNLITAIKCAREYKLFIKLPNNGGYIRVFEDF